MSTPICSKITSSLRKTVPKRASPLSKRPSTLTNWCPPKRSSLVRKFYKQLKAYSPKAYQELKVYRTALGQLQPDNYRDNIVPLHQHLKEQLDERTRGHETNLSDGQIYQRCVNALYQAVLPALIAELMTSNPNSGIDHDKLPKNRGQLYLRFSHMYLRLRHASGDDPAWKQLNPESGVPYQQNYNACFSLIQCALPQPTI